MESQTSLAVRQVRLRLWAEQIRSCQKRPENTTVVEWCRENGITKADYYYRLRQVRKACLKEVTPNNNNAFVELPAPTREDIKADPVSDSGAAAITRLLNGVTIELRDTASSEFIGKLVQALAYVK